MKPKKVTDYINNKVVYDALGQYFWIQKDNGDIQLLAELRGISTIQNLPGMDTLKEASEYQDKIGHWIAEAINQKREAETTLVSTQLSEDEKLLKQAETLDDVDYTSNLLSSVIDSIPKNPTIQDIVKTTAKKTSNKLEAATISLLISSVAQVFKNCR